MRGRGPQIFSFSIFWLRRGRGQDSTGSVRFGPVCLWTGSGSVRFWFFHGSVRFGYVRFQFFLRFLNEKSVFQSKDRLRSQKQNPKLKTIEFWIKNAARCLNGPQMIHGSNKTIKKNIDLFIKIHIWSIKPIIKPI